MRDTAPPISSRPRWAGLVLKNRMWLLWCLAVLGVAVSPLPLPSRQPVERHVRVEASDQGFTPAVITVNLGDRIVLELVATDVVHGLYVDGYDLNVTADPGQPAFLTFVADRPGTYRFRCSVTCGALHPFLIGKLQVGSNGMLWRAIIISALIACAATWSVRR